MAKRNKFGLELFW